jgi:molybdopterin molybdotransferase
LNKRALPTYDDALATVMAAAPPLENQTVATGDALGRTLRAAVTADRDQPPFHRSAMDGFAVRSAQVKRDAWFDINGSVPAGAPLCAMSAEGVMRIATGAALPDGADAVVQIEKANVDGQRVRFDVDDVAPGMNIHKRGTDAQAGDAIIAAGTRLGPQHIGIASAVGACELQVAARPRITLLTSGDEVRDPATSAADLQPQQIRNSNGPMLAAMLQSLGAPLLEHVHIPDDPERTLAAAREAAARSQIVITVGGVSVGQRDFLPMAWEQLGFETILHGVAIQPGKPVFVARDDCKLVIGLPGNPVSVWATAHLFVWPLLQQMLCGDATLPWRRLPLGEAVKAKASRQLFRAATIQRDGAVRIVHWHGSGDLAHTSGASAWARLPLVDGELAAGAMVDVLPWIGAVA